MKVADIEAINHASRVAIAQARSTKATPPNLPYYGYVDVNIHGCPPFVLFTNNDAPVVHYVLRTNDYEPCSLKLWNRLCKGATGIVDIGANIGIYSLCGALLRPDLQVHAFEPNPYAFARLRMHKMLNKAHNIHEHTVAVGNDDQIVPFGWVVKSNGNIASGAGIGTSERTDIEQTIARMIKLDGSGFAGALGSRPVVKIDVEGGEVLVFRGINEILALKPDIILETFSESACAKISAVLEPLGYFVYKIYETEGQLIRQDTLRPCSPDGVEGFNQFLTTRPLPDLS